MLSPMSNIDSTILQSQPPKEGASGSSNLQKTSGDFSLHSIK